MTRSTTLARPALRRLAAAVAATALLTGGLIAGTGTATAHEGDRIVTVTTPEFRVDKEVVGSNEKVPGATVTYRTRLSPIDAPEQFGAADLYAPGLAFVSGTLWLSDPDGIRTAIDTSPEVWLGGDTPTVYFGVGHPSPWVVPGWSLDYEVTYLIRADKFQPGDVIPSGTQVHGSSLTPGVQLLNPIGVDVHVVSPFSSGSAS